MGHVRRTRYCSEYPFFVIRPKDYSRVHTLLLLSSDEKVSVSHHLDPFESAYAQSPFLTKPESILSGDSSKKDVPNLQTGYDLLLRQANWRVGYFTLDYLLPIRLTENSIVFGTAHSEFQGSSTNLTRRADEQVFLSMGGGYRSLVRKNISWASTAFTTLLGLPIGGCLPAEQGLKWPCLMAGHDSLDMHINWYGDLSEGDLINQYRDGPVQL